MKSAYKPKSVKDILTSPEFLAQRERTARYVHHEFQDYAYRLANDLGDISHKAIYMGLAKRENRLMLEQAAAFALGYFKEINKGKIFMWKLQQLKAERQRKLDVQNLDPEFVQKRMSQTQDQLADVFAAKQKSLFNTQRETLLAQFASLSLAAHTSKRSPAKVWDIGCGIGLDARFLSQLGFKVYATDGSAALIKKAKQMCKDCEVTRKVEILENKFKPQTLAGIWCSMWSTVPVEAETTYLAELKTKLVPGGALALEVILGDHEVQAWQEFDWQKDIYIRFEKVNVEQVLVEKLSACGFKLVEKVLLDKQRFGLILTQ